MSTIETPAPISPATTLRTAAYCRVSTDLEDQQGSYDLQMAYYRQRIESDPTMELAGLYGDQGKSGLRAERRPGLQRLLADCEAGKIDLILTKSLSRFARSMADCVELVRRLRELNVTVCFEREGIRTDNRRSDLFMNIIAALAQEESNSISQNMIRCHEQHAALGRPCGQVSYGYYRSGTKRWQINPDEARRVRAAFSMAAEGCCYPDILASLNHMEVQEGTSVRWQQRRVRKLLRNVVYLGDYFSHATVCLTPGRQVINHNYRDRYYIEQHHEPLVSRAIFSRVQRLMQAGCLISYLPITPERARLLFDGSWHEETNDQ